MHTARNFLAAAAALALMGCTSLPADPSKLTPEQLREIGKDKNANVYCARGQTAAGNVGGVSIVLDRGSLPAGVTVTVEPDCKTVIQAPAPAAAASR